MCHSDWTLCANILVTNKVPKNKNYFFTQSQQETRLQMLVPNGQTMLDERLVVHDFLTMHFLFSKHAVNNSCLLCPRSRDS